MPTYDNDWMDGEEVPPLVVREDRVLTGIHQGSVHVESGQFTLAGVIQGSLDIQSGVTAIITGAQQGSVSLESGSEVSVRGAIEGSAYVDHGATLVIEAAGRLAGSLSNYGLVILRGVFGGSQDGTGEFRIEGDGRIKQPIVRDGMNYYEW
jgi:cytoskeletal protein CcmA (bactofilin family)